ncbi:MAG: anaerobic ribonucleoside-triphosphate reductase [Bacilli bacterium]|nr:anaerobic ribonucleoside-triphosphate reductase [Bacilli bacterium]
MKQTTHDNAANRNSYIGEIHSIGEKSVKEEILDSLPAEWAKLHREGTIHIHDLDGYGYTYNCLTFDFSRYPFDEFKSGSELSKVARIFNWMKLTFEEYGNEQSGGMAFPNFGDDLVAIFDKIGVKDSQSVRDMIDSELSALVEWCTFNHTRMGKTSYYVSFNIGLAQTDLARHIEASLIKAFKEAGPKVYKPNIVFKVKDGINLKEGDPNHDLLLLALACTAEKMIPTYLLADCEEDRQTDPRLLSVMGCRTRVVDDLYGHKGATGRGNITNISINLPRIALKIEQEYPDAPVDDKVATFQKRWLDVASTVKDILIDRDKKLLKRAKDDFPANLKYKTWCAPLDGPNGVEEAFKHGTLSIGFIGLSEAVEVLTGKRFYADMPTYLIAYGIVKGMRTYCDFLRKETGYNFSLLATAGELISGRFVEIDSKRYTPKEDIFSKGFYTNSFHVNVDSGLSKTKKIQTEGLFHTLCNGGSISYVEMGEAPLGNEEGLLELIETAVRSGVHYLGFNFPKDICDECGEAGVFDECPCCHSKSITRIRRVSGYLEVLDGFTSGKKAEEKTRKRNG